MKDNFNTLPNDYLSIGGAAVSGGQLVRLQRPVDLPGFRYRGIPYHLKKRHRKMIYAAAKRGLDISVSLAVIVTALPLIAAIVALIKATSPGPVLFRHRRIGKNGVEFDCWKFRTMIADAEQQLKNNPELRALFETKFKLDDDPRITRVGKFLRRTSLDELPQLIQVLQGKMTLIGPRPIVHSEIEKYSIYAGKLFSVTPGLSGLWQTSGRSSTTYAERVLLDMYYIDNRSLRMELLLLMLTVVTVLKKSGAC
jgi:lipopolysaccharide/colanic/teichoic acid biosynthesis glycosyltransferase